MKAILHFVALSDERWKNKLSVLEHPFYQSDCDLDSALGVSHKSMISKLHSFLYRLNKSHEMFTGVLKKDVLTRMKSPGYTVTPNWIPALALALSKNIILFDSTDYSIKLFKGSDDPLAKTFIINYIPEKGHFVALGVSMKSKIKHSFKFSQMPSGLLTALNKSDFVALHVKRLVNCIKKPTVNQIIQEFSHNWITPLTKNDLKSVYKLINVYFSLCKFPQT